MKPPPLTTEAESMGFLGWAVKVGVSSVPARDVFVGNLDFPPSFFGLHNFCAG